MELQENHDQAVHEGCSLLEKVLQDLDLDFILPKYLIQLLGFYGFDNHLSLSEFKDDDFSKLETFARTDLAKLFTAEERQEFFGIYSRDTDLFKIVGGHKILVLKLSEKCKVYLQKRINAKASRKRGPPDEKPIPKKKQLLCTRIERKENKNPLLNEIEISSENEAEEGADNSSKKGETEQTMQQTFDHVKHIVTTYQTNLLNTLEDKDQRDRGIALLKEIKIEIKTDSVLVHCLYCEFVSKAYTKVHNNRKHWILSNVNRHFRTHFKKDKCNLISERKKWKKTTIDGYLTNYNRGEAKTKPDQSSNNISEAEAQSQIVHVIDKEHVSEEVEEEVSVTQINTVHKEQIHKNNESILSDVNRITLHSNVLLRDSDPLISGQEENFSFGRVNNEEIDSANKNIVPPRVPQNDSKNQCDNDLQKLPQPLSRTRSEKLISKRRLILDPNQMKLTDWYEVCEEIEKSVANNTKLFKYFEPVITIANELSKNQQNGTLKEKPREKQTTFFEKLKDAALRNTQRVIKTGNAKGSRFSDSYKKLCSYLFVTSGRLAYETLRANMSNALPCITTLQKSLSEYEGYNEGYINIVGLKTFLQKRNYPRNVIVSEDQTAVIRRVRYNPQTNQLIGCVPVISEVNGFPLKDQFKVNSVKDIQDPIKNQTLSSTAYVYMAQPLVDKAPAFCICLFGSDNRFTSEDVAHRWQYIIEETSKSGINVVGFSSDGDTRCLKNMKSFAGLSSKQVDNPYAPYFQANFCKENPLVFQDTVHIATKLKTRLLKPDIILPMGKFFVSSLHLERLIGEVPKDKHLLTSSDLEGMDKMNFNAIDKLSASHVTNLLSKYDDAQATRQFLILTRSIIDCFLDKTLSMERRIYLIWFSTFFLRLWRAWIKNNQSYTLGKNWITLNTYTCVELNAHALLLLIEKIRADDSINFLPWLCSSQPCEKIFRQTRSMTSTYVTMVNFDMFDFTQRLKRIQAINDIISDTNDAFVFPREENKKLGVNSVCQIDVLPSHGTIKAIIDNAKCDALTESKKLHMNLPEPIEKAALEQSDFVVTKNFQQDNPEEYFEHENLEPEDVLSSQNNLYNEDTEEETIEERNAMQEEFNSLSGYDSLDIKDYTGHNSKSLDRSLLKITIKDKTLMVKKSTLCWLFSDRKGKLSSDRTLRCKGMQSSKKVIVTPTPRPTKARNSGSSSAFKKTKNKKLKSKRTPSMEDSETSESGSYSEKSELENESFSEEEEHFVKSSVSLKNEEYYAAAYDTWHIGRIIETIDVNMYRMKFLKRDLDDYIWHEEDIQAVSKKYIFYGPIILQGNGPFRLKRQDQLNIEHRFKILKKNGSI